MVNSVIYFSYIFINILLPIFILAAVGFLARRKLKLDSRTLSKLNIYIFVPAVIFIKIYSTEVTLEFFKTVLIYIMAMQVLMMLIGEIISRVNHYPRSIKKAFCNSLLFFNSGNYGLPLSELLFKGDPVATTAQVFIILIQNLATNTFGVFQSSTGNSSNKEALKNVLIMPAIYVLFVVIVVKTFRLTVPEQILVPIQYVADGFIGIAIITLGAQLAEITVGIKIKDVLISTVIRLAIAPVIGFFIVTLLGVKGVLAQSLILGVSTPAAVNTAILAKEFDNEPEYASQIVLVSTVLSSVTVPIVIFLVTKYL